MNGITATHIFVWRGWNAKYGGAGMRITAAHIFVWRGYARHTMCASVIPFIPSLNDQNQLSILKYYLSREKLVTFQL